MTCDQIQPLLDAFTAHELGWGTAWRVRRHLAACPACTAELAEIHRLDSRVRAWRDVPAPAHLQSRIAAALPSAPPVSAPRRRPVTARRVAVGLVGMAAAGAAFFWLTPGQPGRPTMAFADVEQAMEQVQTVSWDETMMFYRAGHPVERSASRWTKWLRRNPPALASNGGFQDVRFQDVEDARGDLTRIAPGRYVVFKLRDRRDGSIATKVEAHIREITQPQNAQPPIGHGLLGAGADRVEFSPTRQRHVTLDGQDRILFTRDQDMISVSRDKSENHSYFHIKVWADPITHRVVRIEAHSPDGGGKTGPDEMVLTRNNFHYNQTPPPGVFDWSPPLGAKIYGEMDGFSAMMHEITHAMLSQRRHAAAPDTPAPSRR